jgi:glycine betaine/proline transport system substrate-binding protein
MNKLKKILASIFLCLFASSSFAENVKIGDPGWPGAKAIAHVLAEVVNSKIGGKAEIVPGNNAAIYGAIDRDKGEIQVHPDIWLPNQEGFTKKLVKGSGNGKLTMSKKSI